MLTLEQAQSAIIDAVKPAESSETVALAAADGRFLAGSATALVDNPAFDNSAMDGYAVSTQALVDNNFILPLEGEAACGDAPGKLKANTCMRIFTGAPLPSGADAVVIQEDIKIEGNPGNIKIHFPHTAQPGQNLRHTGEDFRRGDVFFKSGHRLTPADLALLSSAGVAEVKSWRCPRALVIATGNELVSPGTPLQPGQIYESNRLATTLLLQGLGVDVTDGGSVRDEPDAVREMFADAGDYDFVITSGGVSVGDHDLVKDAFGEVGKIDFWKVRVKPGKPVAFGHIGERCHFLGLPGNPVSSLVTFKLFLEPALFAWNHAPYRMQQVQAVLENDYTRHAGRTEFLRAHINVDAGGMLHATILKGQGSHMIGTLAEANGLVRMESDLSELKRQQMVQVILLRDTLPLADQGDLKNG
jgi:molybdopterin molybdotransferase